MRLYKHTYTRSRFPLSIPTYTLHTLSRCERSRRKTNGCVYSPNGVISGSNTNTVQVRDNCSAFLLFALPVCAGVPVDRKQMPIVEVLWTRQKKGFVWLNLYIYFFLLFVLKIAVCAVTMYCMCCVGFGWMDQFISLDMQTENPLFNGITFAFIVCIGWMYKLIKWMCSLILYDTLMINAVTRKIYPFLFIKIMMKENVYRAC